MAKRRSRTEWERLVERWERSGTTQVEFARQAGVKVSTLRWWVYEVRRASKELCSTEGPLRLLPIRIEAEAMQPEPGRLEAEVAGVRLRFDACTEPGYVAALVAALEGRRC